MPSENCNFPVARERVANYWPINDRRSRERGRIRKRLDQKWGTVSQFARRRTCTVEWSNSASGARFGNELRSRKVPLSKLNEPWAMAATATVIHFWCRRGKSFDKNDRRGNESSSFPSMRPPPTSRFVLMCALHFVPSKLRSDRNFAADFLRKLRLTTFGFVYLYPRNGDVDSSILETWRNKEGGKY